MKYSKYLPSKRFQVSLAIAILIVLAAIALTYKKTPVKGTLSVDTSGTSTFSNVSVDPEIAALEQQQIQEFDSLNPTDKLARNLLFNIIANQPANQSMDSVTINSIVDSAIQDMPNKNFIGTTTIDNLNVLPINNTTITSDVTNYVKVYFSVTQEMLKNMDLNLNVIKDKLSENTDSNKKLLDPINALYLKEILALKTVPLHSDAQSAVVNLNLSIINNLIGLIGINNDIINAKSTGDALSVYADLIAYTNIDKSMAVAVDTMDSNLNITFRK